MELTDGAGSNSLDSWSLMQQVIGFLDSILKQLHWIQELE